MYMGVITAYPRLVKLAFSVATPRFPNVQTIEICVTTSGLTEGLQRFAADYPMVEPPKHAHKPRRGTAQHASLDHEGWHRVVSVAM